MRYDALMRTLLDSHELESTISDWAKRIGQAVEAARPRGGDADAHAASGERRELALIGVRRRGDVLAERLHRHWSEAALGFLDITLYRDDLSEIARQPTVRTTEIDFDLDGRDVVLVDDVLMTGRSVRAALNSLSDLGRPRRVWLAVLVDRGGRELPIQPDIPALDLSTSLGPGDWVQVQLDPIDPRDAVRIFEPGETAACDDPAAPGAFESPPTAPPHTSAHPETRR